MRKAILIFLLAAPVFGQSDNRAADRAAIRADIDKIFQAYIHKERDTVKATHDKNWRGFLSGSTTIIRGIDDYMREADYGLKNPNGGMTAYKMVDYDIQFHGNIAVINYIAETEGVQNGQPWKGKLRVIDIYEKQKGGWMQIASNTSIHPDAMRQ